MFWYVFTLDGKLADNTTDPDDLRIIEDRGQALMYIKVLGFKCRVILKGGVSND